MQDALKAAIPGLEVTINPVKARFLSDMISVKGPTPCVQCKCGARIHKIASGPLENEIV